MRILYNSRETEFKSPFGTLVPGQTCTINVHVPASVQAEFLTCELLYEDHSPAQSVKLMLDASKGAYQIFRGEFKLDTSALYFYYFRVHTANSCFRLFRQGDDTNMEAGDLWQLSCVPVTFHTPDWAKGALIYQVFPDRFYKSGSCDLTGKLEPYTVHSDWDEDVEWRPTPEGIVLNNDFYGGNFKGITEKLPYIASLGVTILYLNPIGKAFSNHRYDTGDYKVPDPMLGTTEDFRILCEEAHKLGMKVILDGVYSHTGSNSRYFNRENAFEGVGAFQSRESPFYSWYTFYEWPYNYHSWWDFNTLPTIHKMDPAFIRFIISDEDSVVAHWLKLGADGFRLDVADELPDEFLKLLYDRVKELKPDALVLGEVWEDASNKKAYNLRRTYFTNAELDSVMNYPFRTAILNFMRGWDSGRGLKETVMSIVENYPPEVVAANMNLLGTHDTPRILTALVDDFDGSREEKARRRLSRNNMEVARERLLMASFLQYTLPGSPSLYYGDEALMEGYKDPFNRRTYPWGREDWEMLNHFKRLGKLRRDHEALRLGDIRFFEAEDKHLGFVRTYGGKSVKIYVNRSGDPWDIPAGSVTFGYNIQTLAPDWLTLAPRGFCLVEE
ncbi:MAG: glycoside hydrolase family 13 protein [Oscillospiraceae bacterium]|nr:glycoside hydrolase family 13 protein [Oscillospiraceae bacterium]